jgi:hypothetical protein
VRSDKGIGRDVSIDGVPIEVGVVFGGDMSISSLKLSLGCSSGTSGIRSASGPSCMM